MAALIRVSGAPVQFDRSVISSIDFEVQGIDAQHARLRFNKPHRLPAESHAAPPRFDVQLVNEGVHPAVLETETQGQNNVANGHFPVLDEPSAPKLRMEEKFLQRRAK